MLTKLISQRILLSFIAIQQDFACELTQKFLKTRKNVKFETPYDLERRKTLEFNITTFRTPTFYTRIHSLQSVYEARRVKY